MGRHLRAAAVVVLNLFQVGLVVGLFVSCMAALIGALIAFLRDVNLSLAALKLELEP